MLLRELKQILADYPAEYDDLEVCVATDPLTGPYKRAIRGSLLKTAYGPLYLVTNYKADELNFNPWEELDEIHHY